MGNSQSSRISTLTSVPPTKELMNRSSENARGRKSSQCDETATTQGLNSVGVINHLESTDQDSDDDSVHAHDHDDSDDDEEFQEMIDEKHRILNDVKMLKQLANFYLHPEEKVNSSDPLACARNYYYRPSAPYQISLEECNERACILQDVKQLRLLASFHLHPEKPVETTDPTVFARNFFTRVSATEQEPFEDTQIRAFILEEVALLKKHAEFHLHPERMIGTQKDPTSFGRNFFCRFSAPEHFTQDEIEERDMIMKEVALLRQHAQFHLHPEKPVCTLDASAFGRNYFMRESAPVQVTIEEANERAQIIEEAAQLKMHSAFYLHPERPVATTDPTACGRNYFSRLAADEYLDEDEAYERDRILHDAMMLKTYAGFHLHPEAPVVKCVDSTCFARNYFMRESAPVQVTIEEANERAQIMEEAAQLKKYAAFYLHPERPVESTDVTVCGRNYFTRPSASAYLDQDEADERNRILDEVALLKMHSAFYLHPERPVVTTDPTACGRNYFSCPTACAHTDQLIASEGHALSAHHESYYDDDFHFDEEMTDFEDFRASLSKMMSERMADSVYFMPLKDEDGNNSTSGAHEGENEGKLSRSPSSIMLFDHGKESTAY